MLYKCTALIEMWTKLFVDSFLQLFFANHENNSNNYCAQNIWEGDQNHYLKLQYSSSGVEVT